MGVGDSCHLAKIEVKIWFGSDSAPGEDIRVLYAIWIVLKSIVHIFRDWSLHRNLDF